MRIVIILFALLISSLDGMGQHNCLPQSKDVSGMKDVQGIKYRTTIEVRDSDYLDLKSYPIGKLWSEDGSPFLTLYRKDKEDNYLLSLLFFSYDGFYVSDQPTIILTDEFGEETKLRQSPVFGTVYQAQESGGIRNLPIHGPDYSQYDKHRPVNVDTSYLLHTQTYFSTDMFFSIPDIDEFADRKYVKLSFSGGGLNYDLREGGAKTINKFNKKLRKAVKHITK